MQTALWPGRKSSARHCLALPFPQRNRTHDYLPVASLSLTLSCSTHLQAGPRPEDSPHSFKQLGKLLSLTHHTLSHLPSSWSGLGLLT